MPQSSLLQSSRGTFFVFLGLIAVGLGLYVPTLQPTFTWYNSAEFSIAGITLDVPHQPGYPLFTRLANLFIKIPLFDDLPRRINLLAALAGIFSAGLLGLWLRQQGVGALTAFAAGLWMLIFPTFWEMATQAEVYTLETVLLLIILLYVDRLRRTDFSFANGFFGGALSLLAIGHRPTMGLFLIGFLGILIAREGYRRFLSFPGLLGFCLGAVVGAIPIMDLYFRLQSPNRQLIDPLIGQGFDGFWKFFTAADFRKALGVFSLPELLSRANHWFLQMIGDGGPGILFLPILGLRSSRGTWPGPAAQTCLWILLVNTGFVLNYNAYDAQTMLLPSIMALCGLAALGLESLRGWGRPTVGPAFLFMVLVLIPTSWNSLSPRDNDCERFARRLTALLPEGSTLLVNNDLEFRPLYLLRFLESFRTDLNLQLVDAISEADLPIIQAACQRGPVFSTLLFPANLAAVLGTRFHLFPMGLVYQIVPGTFTPQPLPGLTWMSPFPLPGGGTLSLSGPGSFIPLPGNSSGQTSTEASDRRGACFQYCYQLASATADVQHLVLATVLVDANGMLPARHGVVTAHDLHRPGEELVRGSTALANLPQRHFGNRTLMIPESLGPGHYEVRVLVGSLRSPGWENVFAEGLSGVNLLSVDGETDLFKLQNAMGMRPLLRATAWNVLLTQGPRWLNASNPVILGAFDVPAKTDGR